MVWRYGWSGVALSLALVGCSNFVEAETGPGDGDSSGTNGTTNATVTPSTSGQTDSATGGTDTTRPTSGSNTDPTLASNTNPSESDTTDPVTSSATDDTDQTTDPTGGATGDDTDTDTDTTGDETTGPGPCVQADMEANDMFEDIQDIGTQTCEASASSFTGTLLDANDLDRFTFNSAYSEESCGTGEPDHVYTSSGPVELCAQGFCTAGPTTAVYCDEGEISEVNGFEYCCSTETVRLDIECNTPTEATVAYIAVRANAEALECAEYSFTYAVQFDN